MDLFNFIKESVKRDRNPSMLARQAYIELYPEKEIKYDFYLKYSRKFNAYNANVKMFRNSVTFHFSKDWKKISKEIQIGLMQELLGKLFKDKKKTMNMELYNIFLKNVHVAVPKTKNDEILEASFNRMNEMFFFGMMDRPNLQWGSDSTSQLGRYEYGSDTITMSTIFKDAKIELLDYVMYHEMLHKKFKFQNKNGRTMHHSKEFKKEEAKYPNHLEMEKEISRLARKHRYGFKWF